MHMHLTNPDNTKRTNTKTLRVDRLSERDFVFTESVILWKVGIINQNAYSLNKLYCTNMGLNSFCFLFTLTCIML